MNRPAWVPQVTRVKNELVWWLAIIVGLAQALITHLDELSFDQPEGYYGIAVAVLGFIQRMQAYGKETVAEIEQRYEGGGAG